MVVWAVAMVAVCHVPSARSEEYHPVVEDRVDARLVKLTYREVGAEERDGWDLDLVISAAYDDNIFLSADDPESDMVFQASPEIAYSKGSADRGEGGFVKAAYRPTLVLYASNGDENRVDHQAIAVAGWRGKVTRLTYTGSVRKLGDATPETGSPTDRLDFENELRAAWLPREKVAIEVAAGHRQADYSDPGLNDSDTAYGEVAVRYLFSPKTELGLVYRISRLHVDRAETQDAQQVTAEFVWQPRKKIRTRVEAGAEYRKTDDHSEVNPVLEGRVEWMPRNGTEVYLAAYMREEASAFYPGQNYSVRGVAAGVSQRINRIWSATLEGGYERNSYRQVSGPGSADRRDEIWFLRPALACRLSDESELSFFYRISDNDSNDPAFGYDRRMFGVEWKHTF